MIRRKEWNEFRKTGLLWFINTILHTFGWAIVVEMENGLIKDAYPARVKYRGFDNKSNSRGYRRLSKYMKDNADELYNDIKKED